MKTIRRISPTSIAKLSGLLYAVFGFIAGLVLLVVSLVAQSDKAGNMGIVFGIGAPIALPIMYGVMGWVGGYISGLLYNFFAKKVGGIQIEIE